MTPSWLLNTYREVGHRPNLTNLKGRDWQKSLVTAKDPGQKKTSESSGAEVFISARAPVLEEYSETRFWLENSSTNMFSNSSRRVTPPMSCCRAARLKRHPSENIQKSPWLREDECVFGVFLPLQGCGCAGYQQWRPLILEMEQTIEMLIKAVFAEINVHIISF